MIKISVLLPAFNAERYIKDSIDSILNQTYDNFELLISDDASTDNTKNIIDSYNDPRIKTFHNTTNFKKPLTIQKLFDKSTGDIITMHDADDVSLPNRFEEIANHFKEHPDIHMCGHSIERISEDGRQLKLYRKKVSDYEEIKKRMARENTDGDPSMFIKRGVLEELGVIFRPYFQNNMDYDLALRIIERYKTTNLTSVLSYYRNVASSLSKDVPSYHKLITQQITQYLAKERESGKPDALKRGDILLIKELEAKYAKPYLADPTLHLRKMAEFFMYVKMNKSAINYMWMAVKREPYKLSNWHTLQYCIRKTLFKF